MKKNHKMRKIMLALFSAMLLVCVTIGATVAYLTSTDEVVNTFTVGNVTISLDETDVDLYGQPETAATQRVKTNDYKLMPSHTYTKDPIVHVAKGSEDCYVFIKVVNGIAAYEAATVTGGYTSMADQIVANGWTALEEETGVYYQTVFKETVATAGTDLKVFEQFKVADDAESTNGWSSISPETTQVTITAYAIQKDGFNDNVAGAWDAVETAAAE